MEREQAINIAVGCVMASAMDQMTKKQVTDALRGIERVISIEAESGDIDELIERLKAQNKETDEARKRPDHGGNY